MAPIPTLQTPWASVNTEGQPQKVRTIRVSNLSLGASPLDIKKLFSYCGDIEFIQMQSDSEQYQIAFVIFKDSHGAGRAVLLSGMSLVDSTVSICLAPNQHLPLDTSLQSLEENAPGGGESTFLKAKDIISSILAKGYVLGKDAVNKAKALDEKHQLTSKATANIVSFDKKIGFSEKVISGTSVMKDKHQEVNQKLLVSEKVKSALAVGTFAVNKKVLEVDQKLQVSGNVKTAISAAQQSVDSVKSAAMKNQYVSKGASFVTGAFDKVSELVGEVGQHTKESGVGLRGTEK